MAPSVDGCFQQRALSCRINCTASVRASAAQAGLASPWVSAFQEPHRDRLRTCHAVGLAGWLVRGAVSCCLPGRLDACLPAYAALVDVSPARVVQQAQPCVVLIGPGERSFGALDGAVRTDKPEWPARAPTNEKSFRRHVVSVSPLRAPAASAPGGCSRDGG